MGFFSDEKKMYIPLSIDTAETKRGSYFLSNKKVVEMVIALLPYMLMMYPMLQGGVKILPMVVITVVYAFLYTYFMRFRIFEESRLRGMIRELDKNKVSGVDHFWGINKIGSRGEDDGVIHYQRERKTTRGLVVAFDRGSTVGVQEGNYRRFREAKMHFLRELHLQKFNFQWYEIPKRSETPEQLINYFNLMTEMENPYFKKLLKLQVDINILFSTDAEQRYVDYILIRNSNFRTLRRFKSVVQGIIDTTLETNGYIVEPRILDKSEVENFFEDILQINSLDSNNIRKGVETKPFENYAKVNRVIRKDGRELPLEFIDDFDLTDYGRGLSLEDMLVQKDKRKEYRLNDVKRRRDAELDKARIQRTKDRITDMDYKNLQTEINEKFDNEEELIHNEVEVEVGIPANTGIITQEELKEQMEDLVDTDITMRVKTTQSKAKELTSRASAEDDENLTLEELMRRNQGGNE